jgi:hypothetical protein
MRVCHSTNTSIMRTSEQPGPLEPASARAGQSDWQPGAYFRHRRGVDSESESPGGSETASALAVTVTGPRRKLLTSNISRAWAARSAY